MGLNFKAEVVCRRKTPNSGLCLGYRTHSVDKMKEEEKIQSVKYWLLTYQTFI